MSLKPRPWLLPLTPLYRAGLAVKNHLYATRRLATQTLANPVLSIGSLSTGGAGKTPAVLALAGLLTRNGHQVDVLSRGYGRTSQAVAHVDPNGTPQDFGDEPLELARAGLSVFVAAERYQAGFLAEQTNPATIHLLDDGFQHRRLARTADFVCLTLADLHDHLLPAGNLREPLISLRRAQAILLREEEAEQLYPVTSRLTRAYHWTLRRTLTLPPDAPTHPFAFCALARPQSFFSSLPLLAGQRAFPDHHPYPLTDCDPLIAAARQANANGFLTTAKDAVKLTPAHHASLAAIGPVAVATLTCTFLHERDQVLRQLRKFLPQDRPRPKTDRTPGD